MVAIKRPVLPLLVALAALGLPPARACFWPDGSDDGGLYLPCASDSDVCCKKGDPCLEGPVCQSNTAAAADSAVVAVDNNNITYYRPNCRSAGRPAQCGRYCANAQMPYLDAVGGDQLLGRCETKPDVFYCRDGMESVVGCGAGRVEITLSGWGRTFGSGGRTAAPGMTETLATAATTVTAVPGATSDPTRTAGFPGNTSSPLVGSGSASSRPATVPIAVGVSVAGAVVVAAAAVLVLVLRRRRRGSESRAGEKGIETKDGSIRS